MNTDNAMAEEIAAVKAFLAERREAARDDERRISIERLQTWISRIEPAPDAGGGGDSGDRAFSILADALLHGAQHVDPGFRKLGAAIQSCDIVGGEEENIRRNGAFVFAVLAFTGIHARLNHVDAEEIDRSIDAAQRRLATFPALDIAGTSAVGNTAARISEKAERIVSALVEGLAENNGKISIQRSAKEFTLNVLDDDFTMKESRIEEVKNLTQAAYASLMFYRDGREPTVPIDRFEDCVSVEELGVTLADMIRRRIVVSNVEKMDARRLVFNLFAEFAVRDGFDIKNDAILDRMLKAFYDRITGSTAAPKGKTSRRGKSK